MVSLYGGLLCRHCINCIHAVNDPEIGYTCGKGKYLNIPNPCDKYYPDAEYIRKQTEEFIERYSK